MCRHAIFHHCAGAYQTTTLYAKTVTLSESGVDKKNVPYMDLEDVGSPVQITVADLAPYLPDTRTTWRHLLCEAVRVA